MSYRMENLEALSDEELRVRLVQYGFQNLPVTSTTRKVLIKKLRNHMDTEKQKIRRETSYATRYSSGEESESGNERRAGGGRTSKKNVRATVAASVASAASAAAAAAAASMPPPPSARSFKRVTTGSAYNSAISSTNGSSSSSSSNSSAKPTTANSNHNKSISPPGRSSVYISPVYGNDSEEEDYAALRVSSRSYSNSTPAHSSLFRKTAFASPAGGSSYPTSGANANSSGNTNHSGTSLNDSNNSNGSTSAADAPYISEYTKRLLQFRGETVSHENYNNAIGSALSNKNHQAPSQQHLHQNLNANSMGNHIRQRYTFGTGGGSFSSRLSSPLQPSSRYTTSSASGNGNSGGGTGTGNANQEFNENDIVTHAQPAPEPPQIPIRMALSNLITKLDEHYGFKQTFIPCALLCLFVTFLVFVAFMYLTISTDIASTLSSIDTRYDLCEERTGLRALPERCVLQADVEPALELLKLIGPELKERVERSKCVDTSVSYLMSADEVLQYAKEQNPALQTRHLHAMEYLIERNPQWRIEHCDADGSRIGFDQVLQQRSAKTNHFAILEPKLPFTCMLYNKFRTFFVIVGGLGLAGIAAYFVNYFFKFVLYVKQKRKDQVNAMISDIIQAVSQAAAVASESADPNQDGRVVISHLRDRILTPENRRRLDWAWTEALHFLEHNESRIQFEVGSIGGEDFKMMRWIDTAPLPSASGLPLFAGPGPVSPSSVPPRGGGGAKKWQSPAFDKSNKIHDPPTPCLKVRQMFDKYEVNDPNLKTIVQDAILEKVGNRCRIYDIQLDRNTCCVYVRCASAKDAGIVHDEINGWWFDNRLVSIKFLRLERFQARFPRSLAGPACLKPSNKNNASMTHQLMRFGKLLNRSAGGSDDGDDDTEPAATDPDQDDNDDDDDDDDDEDEGDRLESDDHHHQQHRHHLHHQ